MRIKKTAVTVGAGIALAVGLAAPAFAASVGGGTWYHSGGSEGDTITSEYLHPTACHSATAINAKGVKSKVVAARTYWARAAVPGTNSPDYAYWDNEATGC